MTSSYQISLFKKKRLFQHPLQPWRPSHSSRGLATPTAGQSFLRANGPPYTSMGRSPMNSSQNPQRAESPAYNSCHSMMNSTAHRLARHPLLLLVALLAATATAQQPATTTYDVVSIRPNNSLSGSTRMSTNPGILTFTNVTLKQMLSYAYGIREGLISGLPGWAESAHFDISAKVVDPDMPALKAMTGQQRATMLVPMLADRFGAIVHTEIKELPVYDLVLAKGGPKFKEYVAPTGEDPKKGPGLGAGSTRINNFDMTAVGIPMSSLAETLARQVDKTVIDKTGLTGKYDLELKFTPDNARMNGQPMEPTDEAPSIFTAVQEQLGLKLIPAKGPVVTLVVNQIKEPTEN
jgi:uncharacterized protein (TIGR03435 family)